MAKTKELKKRSWGAEEGEEESSCQFWKERLARAALPFGAFSFPGQFSPLFSQVFSHVVRNSMEEDCG
jgi:hypothetical protein